MQFFELVRREAQGSWFRLGVMTSLGGLSNAAVLFAVNAGAQDTTNGKPNIIAGVLFIVSLIVFFRTHRYILITATAEMLAVIHRVRVSIINQVLQSELLEVDAIGRAEIVAVITKEMN